MGTLYKRGSVWWLQYYHRGQQIRESSGSPKKMVAKKLLDMREGEIAQGKMPSYLFEKVMFEDLSEGLIADYKINRRKTLSKIEQMIRNHLEPFFGGMKVPDINTGLIMEYVLLRQAKGAANGTINRELTALKRMMNIGAKQSPPLVDRIPNIQMLKEDNVRKGFFEHEEYLRLHDVLPEYLKGVFAYGYRTGWRIGEIENLTWDCVDLEQGVVRLEPGETKSGHGRSVIMDEDLSQIMKHQMAMRRLGCPYVFHREGLQIKNYYPAWRTACKEAGLQGRVFHDLRRTAIRNMVRAGVPERVVMMISGHRTRSIMDRYNIVSEQDLRNAAALQSAYLNGL